MNLAPMKLDKTNSRIAFFLATSGHSGVDRVMKNLIYTVSDFGIIVDVLQIRNHGPYLGDAPKNIRIVDLGVSHVNSALFPLIHYLRTWKPVALLCDKDKVNRLALWAARLAKSRCKVTVRTGTTVSKDLATRSRFQRTLQRFSMHNFYPWAHAIIVPSIGAADDLAHYADLDRNIILAIPSPVITGQLKNSATAAIDHPWFLNKTTPIILGVGELCERKDFTTLIDAFHIVQKHIQCRLVIFGEGRRRQMLLNQISKLGLEGKVSLPGFVQNPYPYMSRADVFVLSSKIEGSPVVLMEAIGLGVPSVSTDCPSGPREILQDGKIGRLAPVGNPKALANAIMDTLSDPIPAETIRQASTPYTAESSAKKYLEAMGVIDLVNE